ncbi:MAG: YbjN domain-containing protein [Ilumatobacter sp.]
MSEPVDAEQLAVLERRLDEWLGELDAEHDHIVAVERGEGADLRWFVRMRGDDKDFTTAWLTLGQRTLRYETYVMPAPEENHAVLYENLLRRNDRLVGAHFSIGAEDGVFLRGELETEAVAKEDLDRILGVLYATVEQSFTGLLRIGFASRFSSE